MSHVLATTRINGNVQARCSGVTTLYYQSHRGGLLAMDGIHLTKS